MHLKHSQPVPLSTPHRRPKSVRAFRSQPKSRWLFLTGLITTALITTAPGSQAQQTAPNTIDQRIQKLEQTLQDVMTELEQLRREREDLRQQAKADARRAEQMEQQQQAMLEEIEDLREAGGRDDEALAERFPTLPTGLKLGAYGEHHFNFKEGGGNDISDIHRFVGFVGYDFADWLHFNSETEIEHAFVSDDDGELSLEQFYVDVNMKRWLNLRVGRVLHPAGIINRYHEPTSFLGVERPSYARIILPSTWSIDGAGFWGQITDWLSYEVYAHAGLAGSGFSGSSGIRGGRIKERPSLNDAGGSGRIDLYPFTALGVNSPIGWRTGFSYSHIGTENGDQGRDAEQPDGTVQIFAADTELTWRDWEFRGEIAFIDNEAAEEAGVGAGAADEIFGTYGQLGYHFWPTLWKTGRLADADAVIFVRYEYADPQFGDVTFGTRDRTRSIRETTVGLSFYPVPNLVFKADYTFADSVGGDHDNRFDVGFGYDF